MMRSTSSVLALAGGLTLAVAQSALAEQALVITNFAYEGDEPLPEVRDLALEVSETLFGLGYTVTRLENPDGTRIDTALAALEAATGPVVFYYAGQTDVVDDRTMLLAADGFGRVDLNTALAQASRTTETPTLAFLDVCLQDVAAPEVIAPDPDGSEETLASEPEIAAPEPTPLPAALGDFPDVQNLFVASSVVPGEPCMGEGGVLTDMMLERLLVPGLELATLFSETDVAMTTSLQSPFVLRQAQSGIQLTADDYRVLDAQSPEAQAKTIALWRANGIAVDRAVSGQAQAGVELVQRETVVISSPLKPVVSGGASLVPVAPTVTRLDDVVSLAPRALTPTPVSQVRPVPGAGGLPEPSIIVGNTELEATEAAFSTTAPASGPLAGSAFDYTDKAARRALRDADTENFETLVSAGAFDPPADQIAFALQTELRDMNCYTSTIDGIWGGGSRRSVERYYEEIGGASPSQDPAVSIFRQIMLRDDVRCPDVVAAPTPTRTPTTQTARTPTPTTTQTPATTTTQQPATPSRTMNQTGATGVFR